MGLVSYYMSPEIDGGDYATKKEFIIKVKMSKYQEYIYKQIEDKEKKMEGKKDDKEPRKKEYKTIVVGGLRQKIRKSSTYKTYTRQACNFVFPTISDKFNNDKRPRPRDFKIDQKRIEELLKNNESIKTTDVKEYNIAIKKYIEVLVNYFKSLKDKSFIEETKQILDKDNYIEYVKNNNFKSKLMNELYNCSSKILYIVIYILKKQGLAHDLLQLCFNGRIRNI